MKIKESRNLKYTKTPFDYFEPWEKVEPEKCLLEDFQVLNDKIELVFKNGTSAFIEGRNPKGGLEVDRIEEILGKFIGRTYEEILNANI
jgi:hypothetical protein